MDRLGERGHRVRDRDTKAAGDHHHKHTVRKADAERIALATVQDSTVVETRLDSDNGRTVWNVHLSTPGGTVEVKVDAQTGTVRLDDRDEAPSTGPSTETFDDHGHGGDDRSEHRSGHDVNDDHGHGGDDDSGHH